MIMRPRSQKVEDEDEGTRAEEGRGVRGGKEGGVCAPSRRSNEPKRDSASERLPLLKKEGAGRVSLTDGAVLNVT